MTESSRTGTVTRLDQAKILLNPNSFRIQTGSSQSPVPDEDIPNPTVQATTHARFLHAEAEQVWDAPPWAYRFNSLRASMVEFGWTDVEPLRIRPLANGQFVAVDGNRRLVMWRELTLAGRMGEPLFVDALVVDGQSENSAEEEQAGLRHAVPTRRWSSLSVAVWLDARHQEPAGAPRHPFPSRQKRLFPPALSDALAILRAHPDPIEPELEPELFDSLMDAVEDERIHAWLKAGSNGYNPKRVARLVEWFTVPYRAPHDTESEYSPTGNRKWGQRVHMGILNVVFNNEGLRKRLDAGEHPLRLFSLQEKREVRREPSSYLHPWVSNRIAWKRPLDAGRAQQALADLREAIRRANEEPVESGTEHPWPMLPPPIAGLENDVRIRSLRINRYRGLANVTLDGLERVNLLVGVNNAGKTSVLEGLYILSRLADPRGLLDTLQVRTRQDPERDPRLLSVLIEKLEVDIEAVDSANRAMNVRLARLPTPAGVDLAAHIPGFLVQANVDGDAHVTTTELSSHRPRKTTLSKGKNVWLAPAALHSPYARMERAVVMSHYEKTVDAVALEVILEALREAIDGGIEDIRLVSDSGRFVVEHRSHPPMDISAYGEGLQRMFEIGLLFAAHQGGLVLIDELETAIHPGAMIRFTRLVQELAVKFDVQVFITTHSKEAVDAFLLNQFRTEDIVAFGLYRRNEGLEVVRYPGESLLDALAAINIDIRRG